MTAAASLLTERAIAHWRVSSERLLASSRAFTATKENALEKGLIAYAASNPLNALNKGFLIATKGGKRVSSARDISEGDELTLQAKDGRMVTTVKEITYDI